MVNLSWGEMIGRSLPVPGGRWAGPWPVSWAERSQEAQGHLSSHCEPWGQRWWNSLAAQVPAQPTPYLESTPHLNINGAIRFDNNYMYDNKGLQIQLPLIEGITSDCHWQTRKKNKNMKTENAQRILAIIDCLCSALILYFQLSKIR